MKIYAVIDTNVIVSALLSRFKNTSTVQLMQHLILGDITPIYNDDILNDKVFKYIQTVKRRMKDMLLSLNELYDLTNGTKYGASVLELIRFIEICIF